MGCWNSRACARPRARAEAATDLPRHYSVFVLACYLFTHSVIVLFKHLACSCLAIAQGPTQEYRGMKCLLRPVPFPSHSSYPTAAGWDCSNPATWDDCFPGSSFVLCEQIPRQQNIALSDNWNQYSLSGLRMLLLVSSAFSTSDLSE